MMHQFGRVRRQRAFSLVELIVVIGIIAILLALLMPALTVARERSRGILCASNLHQLGIALYVYADNSHGRLPSWSGWHPYPHAPTPLPPWEPRLGWTEELAPYYVLPNNALYNCPSFPEGNPLNYFIAARWTSVVNVAAAAVNAQNQSATQPTTYLTMNHSMNLSDVKMTSRFVLSGDCTAQFFYNPPFGRTLSLTPDCDKDDANPACLIFAKEPGGINVHHGYNNVLFDDGHVTMYSAFNPAEMTYSPVRMQNWQDVTPN